MPYSLNAAPHPSHPRSPIDPHPGFKDLTGKVFGYLTVMHYCGGQVKSAGGRRYPIWACRCECGTVKGVYSASLTTGKVKSCGCKKSEMIFESKATDLSGMVFGHLTVTGRATSDIGAKHRCVCSCGRETLQPTDTLTSGKAKQCRECALILRGEEHRTHGLSSAPEYHAWKGLRSRCSNPNNNSYKHYGARGIKVCSRWESSFEDFLSDMGRRPSPDHSIDRIDNDGPYSPDNCRWATKSEQAANRRRHTYGRAHSSNGQFLKNQNGEAA